MSRVMLFTEEKAYNQLRDEDIVATYRTTGYVGDVWVATERPIKEKKFDAKVTRIQELPYADSILDHLSDVWFWSGFPSTAQWVRAIKRQFPQPPENHYIKIVERIEN